MDTGIESVAITSALPASDPRRIPYEIAGALPIDDARRSFVAALTIDPAHFSTLRVPAVSPVDPFTLMGTSAVLIASAALGCFIPALRATRVAPIIAPRQD